MRHKTTMRLGDFIQKEIVIPCYQRGYIWGKKHSGTEHNAVTFILDSLKKEVEPERKKDLFIQGITVVDKGNSYVVIDGQQRITFFYLLLKTLGDGAFSIRYTSSRGCADGGNNTPQQWLDNYSAASDVSKEDSDDEYQDVYYFKKTVRLIKEHALYADDAKAVCNYVREHVVFLLIPIDEQIAVSTFSMMNGNKAIMEGHELIKADLLRRASLGTGGYTGNASEWDNISLRSRYAHEWDKWLHWWNKKEVQLMYNSRTPMGWLLHCAFETPTGENLFEKYSECIAKDKNGQNESQKAKLMFSKLRSLQNKFEEAFADVKQYNALGIITYMLAKKDIPSFINEYFSAESRLPHDLEIIYNLLLCGMTYKEIIEEDAAAFEKKKTNLLDVLVNNPVYGKNNELAYRYLLIRNVEADNQRKFNFSILDGNRSLEHIYPKSKIVHEQDRQQWMNHKGELVLCLDGLEYGQEAGWMKDGLPIEDELVNGYITRESIQKAASAVKELKDIANEMTEHSIGNLLLLFQNNNAEHKDKLPEIKRRDDFFDTSKPLFESRNLLHTLMSFGRYPHFGAPEIAQNQKEVLTDINKRIEILTNYMKGE